MCAEAEFDALESSLQHSALRPLAANVFLPGTLKVVGPDAVEEELAAYAATALGRASRLGVEVLVFGSGALRAVPPGFSRNHAIDQFAHAVRVVQEEAGARGITLAVEPLHSEETNLLNSIGEAAAFLRDQRLAGVRLVADLWHMECEGEGLDALDAAADLIVHTHVAAAERHAPGQAPDNIESFLRRLGELGYKGACSIECRWSDFAAEAPAAVARVRQAASVAGWPAR
jgi:sugar phosphate isomerase/epimerase